LTKQIKIKWLPLQEETSKTSKLNAMPTPSKISVKKPPANKEIKIKYEDKSAGQPQLVLIFEEIKKLLLPYVKAPIRLHGGDKGKIILVSEKEIEVEGRRKNEVWFASALIQKGYVGFYFMPIYARPDKIKKIMQPELLQCLKGKCCFHIKKADAVILGQLKEALQAGYDCYKQMGWV
jgi:hypothetical protein